MTATRFSTLALMAALVVPACTPETVNGKEEVAEDFSSLSRPGQNAFSQQMQIVGSLDYGQTSAAISYKNPPRFRAFKFAGGQADRVIVDVRATNGGDAMAWVLDDSFNVVASNDDAAEGVYDSHIEVVLPAHASRTHYVVFRDYNYKAKRFTVELQGTSGIVACTRDSDCQKITAGCCNRSWTAIANGMDDLYQASLECPEGLMCPLMMIQDTNDVAQCNSQTNACELVDPLAISCGGHRINMHECPEGYVCQGAYLPVDGPGTCRKPCAGLAGLACADGETCIDDPTDQCDAANGDADCGGVCQPRTCGGFGALECPGELECIEDPNDGCDVTSGGADCGSLCSER